MTYKKLLKIGIILIVLASFWVRYTRWWDFDRGCYIKILPSFFELSNANIKRAINIIKYALPDDYRDLCRNVEIIDPSASCGGFGGGCYNYHEGTKRIHIETAQRAPLNAAAVIVHEVCHTKQLAAGRQFSEIECYKEDDRAFKTLTQF
jgi:hypothetical protein